MRLCGPKFVNNSDYTPLLLPNTATLENL